MRRSSSAISGPCPSLLWADGAKPLQGSPIHCGSGDSRASSHPCPSSQAEAAQWLVGYAQYLEHVCGAASSTRTAYLRIVTRFLAVMFGSGRMQWSPLPA